MVLLLALNDQLFAVFSAWKFDKRYQKVYFISEFLILLEGRF